MAAFAEGFVSAVLTSFKSLQKILKGMREVFYSRGPRPHKQRSSYDRRVTGNRRRSPVRMRLRVGLWYQYHRVTRAGEFDPLTRDPYKRLRIEEALLPEIARYEFFDRETGASVSPDRAIEVAVDHVWSNTDVGCNALGESLAVYVINEIAEFLNDNYDVIGIDRRKLERRAINSIAV